MVCKQRKQHQLNKNLTAVINNMALLLNSACYADWGGKWFATAIFSHGKSGGIKKHGSQHADIPHAVTWISCRSWYENNDCNDKLMV